VFPFIGFTDKSEFFAKNSECERLSKKPALDRTHWDQCALRNAGCCFFAHQTGSKPLGRNFPNLLI
jgi:hypothetical protein